MFCLIPVWVGGMWLLPGILRTASSQEILNYKNWTALLAWLTHGSLPLNSVGLPYPLSLHWPQSIHDILTSLIFFYLVLTYLFTIPMILSGEEKGNPLQYSCLENFMDRGAWQATVQRVAESQAWLKWLSRHVHILQTSINNKIDNRNGDWKDVLPLLGVHNRIERKEV